MHETIFILDFGSQYTQLIARRVRELNVYCEIHPYNKVPALTPLVKGIIFSGSPCSVNDANAPNPDISIYRKKIPVLGVCYGAQLMASQNGGEVLPSKHREYGRANLAHVDDADRLFRGVSHNSQVWMSHADTITKIPNSFKVIASTTDVKFAGYAIDGEETWGIQFHPEVYHSTEGAALLKNFVVEICHCKQDWTPGSFVNDTVEGLKNKIGNDKVVMGLSGGVDSSVAALLLHKAIGKNLYCIFVDNGLLRKDEYSTVLDSYKHMGLNVKGVDALGQGTIYPDVIESISVGGPSQTIKSHHNVGGLPETMKMQVVEPLRLLFKDEVRRVGDALGLDHNILHRHPFPGPGLGIRILGDVTEEKVRILQEADSIFIEGLKKYDLYKTVWQAGVILLPVQSVGVMGDERTYENAVALRAVSSTDGMTADWCHLPYEFLGKMSNEIINKVKGINRVVYDISSKPPATIEWE
ncbi:MAG: glutamine-hydrolyzing GMP synthase [Bacteroidetes bacterium]|nr:glutamine-hydrolyzing GMP synthase [Bacteroidota bacterium]